MAKNRGAANLVGLAALGALGYKMLQDKKDKQSPAEVVNRDDRDMLGGDVSPSKIVSGMGVDEYARDNSNAGMYEREPDWESKVAPPKAAAPKAAAPKAAAPKAAASVGGPDERYMEGAAAPKSSPKSSSGAVPDMSQYKPRYTPPGRAPKFNAGARYPTTSFTREDVLRSTEPEYSSRMKKGGAVKKMASGGVTRSSASKRADGIAQKGKTRGTIVMCGGGMYKK